MMKLLPQNASGSAGRLENSTRDLPQMGVK
jgi:hypothetical protein